MSDLNQFHILAHICISFIGAILLLALWYNISKNFKRVLDEDDNKKRLDKGLVYISLSLFVWVIAGLWTLLTTYQEMDGSMVHHMGINLLSTLNNLFLLLALFYFDEAPKFIYNNPKNLRKVIWAIVALALVSVTLAFNQNQPVFGMRLGNLPDFILSGFLSAMLLTTLYRTFVNRGLQIVAVISVVAIILMFLSQLSEVFIGLDNVFSDNLIKIVAKTSLIATFLVLATTWVIQLANTPRQDEMSLQFMDWSLIKISIPSKNIIGQEVDFGSKLIQFKNLMKFAIRRKHHVGRDQCLTVNAGGDIKSQAYLSRIIDNLNEILKKEEDRKLERKDLFTFVGQSQYRLRILPESIKIDPALMEEFVRDEEHENYDPKSS